MDRTKPPRLQLAYVSELTAPLTRTPVHAFDTWVLIWYTRGRGEIEVQGRTLAFAEGDVACIPPRTPYAEIAPRGFLSLWVLAEGVPLPRQAMVLPMAADPRAGHLFRLLLEEHHGRAEGWQESAHLWLAGVVRCLRQRQAPGGRAAETLATWLRRHAAEPAASATIALAQVGGSPVYLRRRFRQAFGMSPSRYLVLHRIDLARQLLRLSALPVADVARQCGFSDPFYFSRLFRRHVGCSPLVFRQHLSP